MKKKKSRSSGTARIDRIRMKPEVEVIRDWLTGVFRDVEEQEVRGEGHTVV